MPRYQINSSEMVEYVHFIEAKGREEAREKFQKMMDDGTEEIDWTPVDGDHFEIISVELADEVENEE